MTNVPGRYSITHRDWIGHMDIGIDGAFVASGQCTSNGKWEINDNILALKWADWPIENVFILNNMLVGENIVGLKVNEDEPSRRIERIKNLKPFKVFSAEYAPDQFKHINEDDWLYQRGQKRYICSILGTLYEECYGRADLKYLILEAVWMARRMNDAGTLQDRMWDDVKDSK